MDAVIELQHAQKRDREMINDLEKTVAIINTKLNAILAVMGTVGVAIVGVLVQLIFGT